MDTLSGSQRTSWAEKAEWGRLITSRYKECTSRYEECILIRGMHFLITSRYEECILIVLEYYF